MARVPTLDPAEFAPAWPTPSATPARRSVLRSDRSPRGRSARNSPSP